METFLTGIDNKKCITWQEFKQRDVFKLFFFIFVGYVSIESMKKFLGEIHDFIPGSSGYLAYHVQDEINMSDIKNKLKNKY